VEVGESARKASAPWCTLRHFGLNVPKIHEVAHVGCKSFKSCYSGVEVPVLKCLTIVVSRILNTNTMRWSCYFQYCFRYCCRAHPRLGKEQYCSLWYSSRISCRLLANCIPKTPQLSMGWIDPLIGLDWVGLGRDLSVLGGLGWVHYSKSAKHLKGLC